MKNNQHKDRQPMGDLTQEQFDKLLDWLDADRDAAALRYANIQLRLIKFFACRGCGEAESLADITIDRVAAKIDWLIANYVGEPILYFHGVANKVHLECLRPKQIPPIPPPVPDREDIERELDCLDQCLAQLLEGNRELAERYYLGEKNVKIKNRKKLAEARGITLDALRIRAHRIRKQLEVCVLECLAAGPRSETI
jgi:DNA-directed RNA polymerase specialized sigma24 family protein